MSPRVECRALGVLARVDGFELGNTKTRRAEALVAVRLPIMRRESVATQSRKRVSRRQVGP